MASPGMFEQKPEQAPGSAASSSVAVPPTTSLEMGGKSGVTVNPAQTGYPTGQAPLGGAAAGSATPKDSQQYLSGPPKTADDWSQKAAEALQDSVDRIFASKSNDIYGLDFSFTIANPFLQDCPLIGCSTGFTKLCGYELSEIVGQNCRFLIDRVPKDQIDQDVRRLSKEFWQAVRDGKDFSVADADRRPWMPEGRPADELVCMQTNMRSDGSLFNNMFYMKVFFLGTELDEEQPYVVALQSEMVDGQEELTAFANSLGQLDANMALLKHELSRVFFMYCSMDRQLRSQLKQEELGPKDGTQVEDTMPMAPTNLHSAFDPALVQPWEESRFKLVKKLCDATRNRGVVNLMEDTRNGGKLVAVKKMPNSWLCKSHEDFMLAHPNETELPWHDIGCTSFLNSVNYKYACNLEGVFCDSENSFVNFSYAEGGDLFDVALGGATPGVEREATYAPLVPEICTALKLLHDMEIAHRDVSLENVLLITEGACSTGYRIRLIDFAMSTRERKFRDCVRGKPSYQAPEMHERGQDYDTFKNDAFAVGVILFSIFARCYPWLSTKPGSCMHFEFVKKHGFRTYCEKRKVQGNPRNNLKLAQCISEPLLQLLDGLLLFNPHERLSLGQKQDQRLRSVWEEPWLVDYLKKNQA